MVTGKRRGRPRKSTAIETKEKKDKFEKEKLELRKKTVERVAKIKAETTIEKTWYEKRNSGRVYRYTRLSNGNKFSSLVGDINSQPGLVKLLEK